MIQFSFIHYFGQASIVVKGVMLLLFLASIFSWSLIFFKWQQLRQFKSINKQFNERFWSDIPLTTLLHDYKELKDQNRALIRVFQTGYHEFQRQYLPTKLQVTKNSEMILNAVMRAMNIVRAKEEQLLQSHLSWLATIGSISPYVGLFGTVWGIMASLQTLGGVQQVTLAVVAPGISEALVATAMGLFTAIPASVAYNRFSHNSATIAEQYEIFQEEFSGLLENELSQA